MKVGMVVAALVSAIFLFLPIGAVAGNWAFILVPGILVAMYALARTDVGEALVAALSRVNFAHPAAGPIREAMERTFPGEVLPAGLRVGVIASPIANAFALGRRTVAVTEGLLQTAGPEELAGVLAHELGHLKHGDALALARVVFVYTPGMWAATLVNWVAWVGANFIARTGLVGWFMAAGVYYPWLAMARLLNFVTTAVVMKQSRDAEFRADGFAGEVSPTCRAGLISFLEKLHAWESQAGRRPGGLVAALLASHPPTRERIERLRGAA
ncbi:MAG: M48 family metalloprotease [Firmicutes bacterium]|nr:M48 family metalloprotease [Bacillota bacterium]